MRAIRRRRDRTAGPRRRGGRGPVGRFSHWAAWQAQRRKWYITRLLFLEEWECAYRSTRFGSRRPSVSSPRLRSRLLPLPPPDPNKVLHVSFPTGENGFDPVRISDLYSATVIEGDLRAAADLRLSRAAGEARADGGRGDARGHRQRQDLHVQAPQGHLLRAGSAFKGAKRELVAQDVVYTLHALRRSEESRAVRVPARGQDRRPRRARCGGEEDRASSTTTRRFRASRSSTATRCAFISRRPTTTFSTSSRIPRSAIVAREVIEALWRGHDGASRRHRAVHAEELDATLEDRARSQSRISRLHLGFRGVRAGMGRRARRRR